MMHPATGLTSVDDEVGLGVIALQPLPAGTLIWVRDGLDRAISARKLRQLPLVQKTALRPYAWAERDRWYLTWDHGRYTNHSCDPNCAGLDGEFDVAIRDIAAGEQITDDYGGFVIRVTFDCRCGSPDCRGRVGQGQPRTTQPRVEEAYRRALQLVDSVPQALWPLVQVGRGRGFDLLRDLAPTQPGPLPPVQLTADPPAPSPIHESP